MFLMFILFLFCPWKKDILFQYFYAWDIYLPPKERPWKQNYVAKCALQCFSLLLDLGLSPSEGLCHPVSLSLEKRNSNTGCSSMSPIGWSEWVTLCFLSGEEFYISILSFIECEMFARRFLCPLHVGDHPLVTITLKFKQFMISQLGFWITVVIRNNSHGAWPPLQRGQLQFFVCLFFEGISHFLFKSLKHSSEVIF